MDIDVMQRQIRELMAFKARAEPMLAAWEARPPERTYANDYGQQPPWETSPNQTEATDTPSENKTEAPAEAKTETAPA